MTWAPIASNDDASEDIFNDNGVIVVEDMSTVCVKVSVGSICFKDLSFPGVSISAVTRNADANICLPRLIMMIRDGGVGEKNTPIFKETRGIPLSLHTIFLSVLMRCSARGKDGFPICEVVFVEIQDGCSRRLNVIESDFVSVVPCAPKISANMSNFMFPGIISFPIAAENGREHFKEGSKISNSSPSCFGLKEMSMYGAVEEKMVGILLSLHA